MGKPKARPTGRPECGTAAAAPAPDLFYPNMPLELIDAAADNPRKDLGDLTELAESMKGPAGIVQPLLLTPRGDRFLCVDGHRRLGAAALAGFAVVPVLARVMDEPTRKAIMLVSCLQRVDLTPLEEAHAFAELAALGWSTRRIAEDVGRSQSHIVKRQSLLELPDEVTALVAAGDVTVSDALELVKLKDDPKALERATRAATGQRGDVAREVDRELARIDEERVFAERVASLEVDGHRVIVSRSPWHMALPEGVFQLGTGWQDLPIDPALHESEPCHAIGVRQAGGDVCCCTDRSRHLGVSTRKEASEGDDAERLAEAERLKEEREQDLQDKDRLQAFTFGLLSARPRKREESLAFVARCCIAESIEYGNDEHVLMAERLGCAVDRHVADHGAICEAWLYAWIDAAKIDALVQLLVVWSIRPGALPHSSVLRFAAGEGYALSERETMYLESRP